MSPTIGEKESSFNMSQSSSQSSSSSCVSEAGDRAWVILIKTLRQCGHGMLADYLVFQENENMTQERRLGENDDIVQQFPRLETALSNDEKQAVRDWVKDKMAQVSLDALNSRTHSRHRDSELELPSHNYKSQVEMLLALNEKDKQISLLQEDIARLQEKLEMRTLEVRGLRQEIGGIKKEHEEVIKKMSKANNASERTTTMMRERLTSYDNSIKAINLRIMKQLGADKAELTNPENFRITGLDQYVKKLMEKIFELEDTMSWRQDQWKDDRKSVLKSIQVLDRGQSVSDSLQDFVGKTREGLDGVLHELTDLGGIVEVTFPQVSGSSHNGNDKLSRLPSEGEYKEIKLTIREVKDKIHELMYENTILRKTMRKSSKGGLFQRCNQLQQLATETPINNSVDSEVSGDTRQSMNLYSGRTFKRKVVNNASSSCTGSPASQRGNKDVPYKSPLLEKKLNGEAMLLPDLNLNAGPANRFLSPSPKDEQKNDLNMRSMEANSYSPVKK